MRHVQRHQSALPAASIRPDSRQTENRAPRRATAPSRKHPAEIAHEFFSTISKTEKSPIHFLNDLMLSQPNLATVLATLDWMLPKNGDEKLHIDELTLQLAGPPLEQGTDTYLLTHETNAKSDNPPARPQSFLQPFLKRIGITRDRGNLPESSANASEEYNGTADYFRTLQGALEKLVESTSKQSLFKNWPHQGLVQTETGQFDLSDGLRDALLNKISTDNADTDEAKTLSAIYPSLARLANNPSIESLIEGLAYLEKDSQTSEIPVDRLPIALRKAILHWYPKSIPLLSLTCNALKPASPDDLSELPLLNQTIPCQPVESAAVLYSFRPTFLQGVQKAIREPTAGSPWSIPDARSPRQAEHVGHVLAFVLQNLQDCAATASTLGTGDPSSWPVALHIAQHELTGNRKPEALIDAYHRRVAEMKHERDLRQARILSVQEAERARQSRIKHPQLSPGTGEVGPLSFIPMTNAPDPAIAHQSTDDTLMFPMNSSPDNTSRHQVISLLAERFQSWDMSTRDLTAGNQGTRDDRCWLRATWSSLAHQLASADIDKAEAHAFNNHQNVQALVQSVLKGLRIHYQTDPHACLGQADALTQKPVQICPGQTLRQVKRKAGDASENTRFDGRPLEDVLFDLTTYAAMGFRFENAEFAREVERVCNPLERGGAAELPIGMHRALLLPCVIIELPAKNAPTLQVRVSLPKDDPRYPAWANILELPATNDPGVATERLRSALSLFDDLPILYLEKVHMHDSIGHYQVFLPKATAVNPTPPKPVAHQSTHITGLIRNAEGHLTQVVAASERDTASRPQLADHVRERLVSLLQDPYACLVAFGSPASAERLKHHSQHHALHPHSSSLIEQTLAALKAAKAPLELAPNLWLERVDLDHNPTFSRGNDTMTGRLMLRNTAGAQPVYRPIPFMLLHPPYDGVAMKATDLCHALHDLRRWLPRSAASADPAPCRPHFFSAGGVGRSASLAVLMSTVGLGKQPAKQSIDLSDIDVTIANVRSNGGHPDFVHTPEQLYEIQKAALATLQNDLAYNA